MNQFHAIFDLLAMLAALGVSLFCFRWRLGSALERINLSGKGYGIALVAGAVIGGYGLGSANLLLSGESAVARSALGALAGAIVTIEFYKFRRGIRGSTGLAFVPAFATAIVIGRIGCFLSGLEDRTHGIATGLPWGHDFGDGTPRHPVQLYESAVMAVFLVLALVLIGRRSPVFMSKGFYLLVLVYAGQRFVWEFFKPYAPLVGPFNLFHFACAALVFYAVVMTVRAPVAESKAGLEKAG